MADNAQAVKDLYRIARNLRTMDKRADDLTPVWRKIGSRIARENRRQFSTRGAFHGTPWKPLRPSTLRQKASQGFGRTPLVRSGDLRRSFTSRPMNIEHYFPHHAEYGSGLDTAGWQHRGTFKNGKRHIPPRKIQKLSSQLRKEIHVMVVQYIVHNRRR